LHGELGEIPGLVPNESSVGFEDEVFIHGYFDIPMLILRDILAIDDLVKILFMVLFRGFCGALDWQFAVIPSPMLFDDKMYHFGVIYFSFFFGITLIIISLITKIILFISDVIKSVETIMLINSSKYFLLI
jgi:hypothetical protein